ncbi:DUF6759 domain-containing protein [Soonwooa sp.]|uniref:DUF6759 domain-containing protein n=1 Tax=Soonwooa sp. TaxID=1938592 RepID=UPI0026253EF4|nr:DUF6759 domain-containing protein [Soonwooa sp.]
MKKIFLFVLMMLTGLYYAQVSVFAAMSSNDPNVVQSFITANPKHPKVPELKKKLMNMRYVGGSGGGDVAAEPKISNLTPKKLEKNINKSKTSESAEKTAAVLTNLFSNDKNNKETVLQIVNRSACELVVKINGKKFYNLNVSSKNQNYILIEKGNYNITTSICGASYTSSKTINANTVITLGVK